MFQDGGDVGMLFSHSMTAGWVVGTLKPYLHSQVAGTQKHLDCALVPLKPEPLYLWFHRVQIQILKWSLRIRLLRIPSTLFRPVNMKGIPN